MTTIHSLPQELLNHIVELASDDYISQALSSDEPVKPQKGHKYTTLSLSETCHSLRRHALPHLWKSATLAVSFDNLTTSLHSIESFTQPSHPVRQYARTLDLRLDTQHVSLSRVLPASLDLRLVRAVAGMTSLTAISLQSRTCFEFPKTMRALLSLSGLQTLTVSSRGNLHLPAVTAPKLEKLLIHSDVGSCRFDLSAFPNLKELSLSMEDNSSSQSWEEMSFPRQLWKSLESLSLRGFVLDPLGPLGKLNESLQGLGQNNSLKAVSYHLARDEQDATFAWQTLRTLPLTSLSFTLPVLFDARYARRMLRGFPLLEKLELFAFSSAAAWQWPGPFEAYVATFADLRSLKTLSINYNELTVPSLPPSLPGPTSPPSITTTANPMQEAGLADEGVADVGEALSLTDADDDDESSEEVAVYGPLGVNFCPDASQDNLDRQTQASKALFSAIPTLQRVSFEPGLTERACSDPFAYKISETSYVRDEKLFFM